MGSVILVDDEYASRQILRGFIADYVRNPSLQIEEYATGTEGLRAVSPHEATLVFFDLSLPDLSGKEFRRQCQVVNPRVFLVVVTQLQMFDLVYDAINAGCQGYLLKPVMRSEVYALLDRWRHGEGETWASAPPRYSEEEWLSGEEAVRRAVFYVRQHYEEPLVLTEIAAHVHLSPSYFSRLFKATMGQSFGEFLTQERLKHARHLLGHSEVPIEIIAQRTGFSSATYFATNFRRWEGKTPRQYRDLMRQL